MLADLSGKVALVTGGGGILGKIFIESLIKEKVKIVLVDSNAAATLATAEALQLKYPFADILQVHCDITEPTSIQEMVHQAVAKFGEINILINNAATKTNNVSDFFKPFEEYTIETWKEVMSVNLDGMFLVAQAIGKRMLEQNKGGSIIQMSSIYGVVAPDPRIYEGSHYLGMKINTPAVYAASKAAVIGLTRYLAVYWAANNIRVNCISPGGIASGQNDIFQKKYSEKVPLSRMGTAEELSKTMLFLASEASSYITGQNIMVDGGFTCW